MFNTDFKNTTTHYNDIHKEGLEDSFWDKVKNFWCHLPLISHETEGIERFAHSRCYIPPSRYKDQDYHTRWD